MDLIILLSIFAGIWALTHFWIVPLLQSSWKTKDLRQKVAKVGILAASEKLREVSGAGLIALISVLFLIWIFNFCAGIDQVFGQSLIRGLTNIQQAVSDFAKSWATFIVWIGILGAVLTLYFIARNAKSRVITKWTERAQQVFERLSIDPNLIGEYADDSELSEIVERVFELFALLEKFSESEEYQTECQEAGRELEHLLSICSMEIARKELDLEQVLTIDETEDIEKKQNPVFRMLISKRFAADLQLINRSLSMLVTALLIISLIGWTSEPLADSMRLAVNNLRVNSLHDNLERKLQATTETAEVNEEELIDDDKNSDLNSAQRVAQLSQYLARISLHQMMNSGILERSAGVQVSKRSKAEFVRAAILQQNIESPTSNTDRLRAAARNTIGQQFNEPEAVLRQIERDLTPKLEELERRDPRLLTQLRQRVIQRYGAPMGALDAQGSLISKIVGQSFSPGIGSINNELTKQGADIAKEIGEKAIGKWARVHSKALVTEALIGQARGEVATNMKAFVFELAPKSKSLIKQVSSSSGRRWTPTSIEAADQSVSRRVAQKVAMYAPQVERAAIVRNLGGYSEVFPTLAQSVAEGIAHSSGQGSPRRSVSTNFRMASRSFRVRGVLFGQDLEADNLNISELRWKFEPNREISITVKSSGIDRHLGMFDAGILNQALRYAADQRVIATTITPGDGRVISRVTYLHPTLLDTPLGCRIIEADRFVDALTLSYTGSQVDHRLQDISDDRKAIHRWLKFAKIAENIQHTQGVCPAKKVQELAGKGMVVTQVLSSRIQKFVNTELVDSASSDLVKGTLACAAGNAGNAGSCLCNRFSQKSFANRYWFPEDHTSQFRESEHRLDAEFKFANLSKNALGHVDLWLHTTFAIRDSYKEVSDESTTAAFDFSTDQLNRVNKILKDEKIPKYLQTQLNMSANEFLQPVEQFLILQRLFRAALNGQLGERFPMGQLIELQKETRNFVEYQPTIRWEPTNLAQSQFFQALRDAGEDALSMFKNHYQDQSYRLENKLPRCGPTKIEGQGK